MPDLYPPDVPGSAIPKARILVIDDEADIRESLEVLLSLEGYQVDLAQNAADGLRRLENASYDLVLLDLMMPDRSGMEVLQDVRERDTETPIFMITAYGSVEVAVDALKSGANDYFSKPWDNEKLLIEIDRMIAQPAAGAREHPAQARLKQRYSFPEHHRQERAHAADSRPGDAGCAQPRDHPDHRRNGHRQGIHRQSDPCQFVPRRPDVRPREQRLGAVGSSGIGACSGT